MQSAAPSKCLWNIDFVGASLHNPKLRIMNRRLSSLRSRVLKRIELSRWLQAVPDYGDCKVRVRPEAATESLMANRMALGRSAG